MLGGYQSAKSTLKCTDVLLSSKRLSAMLSFLVSKATGTMLPTNARVTHAHRSCPPIATVLVLLGVAMLAAWTVGLAATLAADEVTSTDLHIKSFALDVSGKNVQMMEAQKKHIAPSVPRKRPLPGKEPAFCVPTVQPAYNHSDWLDMYLDRVAAMKPFAPCPDCFTDAKVGNADLEVSKAKVCSRWWDPNPV